MASICFSHLISGWRRATLAEQPGSGPAIAERAAAAEEFGKPNPPLHQLKAVSAVPHSSQHYCSVSVHALQVVIRTSFTGQDRLIDFELGVMGCHGT